jgi:hypothetical protein
VPNEANVFILFWEPTLSVCPKLPTSDSGHTPQKSRAQAEIRMEERFHR